MIKKTIATVLAGAVTLFALMPSKTFAQTPAQPKAVEGEHTLSGARLVTKPDLKAVFAKEIAKAKTLNSTAAYERLGKGWQLKQSQQTYKSGLTKREKIGFIIGGIIILAVTVLLLVHGIADDPPFCFEEPDVPDCR